MIRYIVRHKDRKDEVPLINDIETITSWGGQRRQKLLKE